MVYRIDYDRLVFDSINDTITTQEDLTKLWIISLWDYAAGIWEESGTFNSGKDIGDEQACIMVGASRDIINYSFEIIDGLLCPSYRSHLPILSFTSWCVSVAPRSS